MGKSAWLIEAPGRMYLCICRRQFVWTGDHNRALQLPTKEQADDLMMAVRELDRGLFPDAYGMPKPTEHGWFDTTPSGEGATSVQTQVALALLKL